MNAKKICIDHRFKESIKKSHTVQRSNLSTRRKNNVFLKGRYTANDKRQLHSTL